MMRIGSLLTLGLFATFLAQPLPVQAAENPNPGKSASDRQHNEKGAKETGLSGIQPSPEDCANLLAQLNEGCVANPEGCAKLVARSQPGEGCMAHVVVAGKIDKSMQGTTCNNGTMACNNPGASCVLGGSKHCKTSDLNGQGNCTCVCIAP